MAEEERSLSSVYKQAEQKRHTVESRFDSNSAGFQAVLQSTIDLYVLCLDIAHRIALFSANESLEDISSIDLPYLLLHYRVAELLIRLNDRRDRATNLTRAQTSYEDFLKRLDEYDILSKEDARLLEQYEESPSNFSTVSSTDVATRRNVKIQRFREEKALKQKLEHLQQRPHAMQDDDDGYRELQLAQIAYYTHQAFQSLESIAQELHILSLAPPSAPPDRDGLQQTDVRDRERRFADGYSERLDAPGISAATRGALLDSKGKPLRPFTLVGQRQELRDGVFRPDHSLPTMSIDEYLEEERRRGGIIDGGGPQSEIRPEVDEDDMEAADRETMKAREWDEYVEANPRGSGNTLNRG